MIDSLRALLNLQTLAKGQPPGAPKEGKVLRLETENQLPSLGHQRTLSRLLPLKRTAQKEDKQPLRFLLS